MTKKIYLDVERLFAICWMTAACSASADPHDGGAEVANGSSGTRGLSSSRGGSSSGGGMGVSSGATANGGMPANGGTTAGGGMGVSGSSAVSGGSAGLAGSSGSSGGERNVPNGTDEMPWFSFFTTSQAGLLSLAPDPVNGFGGNLGGLAGADAICDTLAKRSNPTDQKVWRAFLSVSDGGDGNPVHAIDRIGQGPWYDYNHRLFAHTIAGMIPILTGTGVGQRPPDADPQLAEMFTDENGEPVTPDRNVIDNHDILTGSDGKGRLYGGPETTCQDWTSTDTDINEPPTVGHSWPRSDYDGRNWIAAHGAGGCAAGIDTRKGGMGAAKTVGAGGGYGGIYCFAVSE